MRVQPQLEPLARLRAAVPANQQATLNLLIGSVTMPLDQPHCGTAIVQLAACVLAYRSRINHCRPEFDALICDIKMIADIVIENLQAIQGTQPAGQMLKRTSRYPAWALLSELQTEQQPLRAALGAEATFALLNKSQLNIRYCAQLRRDINKYGRPQVGEDRNVDELKEMGFKGDWLARYQSTDRQVRRRIELADPDGSTSPDYSDHHDRFDILARLKWRFDYPNLNHRQGRMDDNHLTRTQFSKVTAELRKGVERNDPKALVSSLSLLTGLTPKLVTRLPIIQPNFPLHVLGLDVSRGCLILDFCFLFPSRKKPLQTAAGLFPPSQDLLAIPLPVFLVEALRKRIAGAPKALRLADLVGTVSVDSRTSLLAEEHCKLIASLARASKSTAAVAIAAGCDRLVAACLTWDFSVVGSARMYYARLTGKDIHDGCSSLYAAVGWGELAVSEAQLAAVGSHCELSNDGVRHLFAHLALECRTTQPGRRANFGKLMVHHAHYTRYCVALITFNLGLREVDAYRLSARELLAGQDQITVHDKQGRNRLMAQPVPLNGVVREQLRQYAGHSEALIKRLQKLGATEALTFANSLQQALLGGGPLFLFRQLRGGVTPAGAANVWGTLPAEVRVPANAGRHFWQNALRFQGLGSRDIDRFMRHRVIGLENNTTSQTASPQQSFDRIDEVQCRVLKDLGVEVVVGLRSV